MILRSALLASTATLALGSVCVLADVPSATAADPDPCGLTGWFVNPDEADRAPDRTYAGLVFEPADLIHHEAPAGLTTATLNSGDYTASPAPDQPSFFSVEVSGTDGGYATLRYNRLTHLWNMVTGGQFYEHADPDELVDMPPVKRSHTVVRFGVGYTKNPPGTVKTTVTAVSFQGKAYTFSCTPPTQSPSATPSATATGTPSASSATTSPGSSSTPTGSATPSATRSATATPTATRSATRSALPDIAGFETPEQDDGLPVTGASLSFIIAGAAGLLVAGGALLWWTRRRTR